MAEPTISIRDISTIPPGGIGTPITDTIVGGSPNLYNLHLDASTAYIFDVKGGVGAGLHDPNLRVLDQMTGAELAHNDDVSPGHNLDSRIEFTTTAPVDVSLEVTGLGPERSGSYTLLTRADDVADDFYTTDAAAGGVNRGTISTDVDEDFWSIALTANTAHTFNVQTSTTTPGVLANSTLTIFGPDGKAIASDLDGGDSLLNFTPTTTGTYFLDVGGLGDATGDYILTV